MAGAAPIIDTKVWGKGIKPFGADLEKHTWRSFKFVYMNYVGAVSSGIRTKMEAAERSAMPVALADMGTETQQEASTLVFIMSQVLTVSSLQLLMNTEAGNGYEAWRLLKCDRQPSSGSRHIAMFSNILRPVRKDTP